MKRITLEELEKKHHFHDYGSLSKWVIETIAKGEMKPVKASGTNGKKPALYKEYWLIEKERYYEEEREELLYRMVPGINPDYYLKHLDQYVQDRKWVCKLNDYLKNHQEELGYPMAMNERSFAIWQREKFLKQEQGKKILKRCQVPLESLHFYETTEPLSYYINTKNTPQNILVIENKDTYYSMRKYLMEGKENILGVQIGTVIYGAGKSIMRSFQDFSLCMEPFMQKKENTLLYFGDLDYEGIGIYEHLAELFETETGIRPFLEAYRKMLQKADRMPELPEMKEGQNQNLSGRFYNYFSGKEQQDMKNLLKAGKYIPQEILSCEDFG